MDEGVHTSQEGTEWRQEGEFAAHALMVAAASWEEFSYGDLLTKMGVGAAIGAAAVGAAGGLIGMLMGPPGAAAAGAAKGTVIGGAAGLGFGALWGVFWNKGDKEILGWSRMDYVTCECPEPCNGKACKISYKTEHKGDNGKSQNDTVVDDLYWKYGRTTERFYEEDANGKWVQIADNDDW